MGARTVRPQGLLYRVQEQAQRRYRADLRRADEAHLGGVGMPAGNAGLQNVATDNPPMLPVFMLDY